MSWFRDKFTEFLYGPPPHRHSFVQPHTVEHAPVEGGGHTTFIVFGCSCGAYQIFGWENYASTTAAFKEEFRAEMNQAGWHTLVEG